MKNLKKIFQVFKRILPKQINFKKIYIMAVLYSICEAMITFIFSYFGIDKAFKENNFAMFIIIIFAILLVGVLSNIAYATAFRSGNKLTKLINLELREKLFKKVMDLDKEYHNNHATGATINILVGDVEIVSEGFFWPSLLMAIDGFNVFICYILCAIINFKLSLIILVCMPIIFFLSIICFRKMRSIDDKRREAKKKRLSHINDGIMGIKTIKTLNLEEADNKEFASLSLDQKKWDMHRVYVGQCIWRMMDLINAIAIGLLFYFSYNQYFYYNFSYGSLFLFFTLFSRCLYCIGFVADHFEQFSEVLVSAEKIDELLNREPLVKDKEVIDDSVTSFNGEIEFKSVTFKYPKGEKILDNFNLKIESKEKIALVGRTGSGKSTIASLIYRFYEPTGGNILFDGKDYLNLSQSFIRNNIGFILQDALLFDDTVLENIRYGKRNATLSEVKAVCERIGLDEFINKMPNKYNTKVGEGGLLLSNGQKQLIAFARVLLKNPDIIILDEATSSIDSKTEQLIQRCIDNQFKDKTCIFIAHRLSTIKDVDKIIYLDKGEIVEEGSHLELMEKKDKYYRLYTNQFYNNMLDAEFND